MMDKYVQGIIIGTLRSMNGALLDTKHGRRHRNVRLLHTVILDEASQEADSDFLITFDRINRFLHQNLDASPKLLMIAYRFQLASRTSGYHSMFKAKNVCSSTY